MQYVYEVLFDSDDDKVDLSGHEQARRHESRFRKVSDLRVISRSPTAHYRFPGSPPRRQTAMHFHYSRRGNRGLPGAETGCHDSVQNRTLEHGANQQNKTQSGERHGNDSDTRKGNADGRA